ncbi:thioredoxin domain-containing protein [Planctomonas psychrotolerans]|uniref:thioredoxin domain-containing protein n=1 Tax=Planctomonas psychrotolerans TaxID=2528712 RepID=UPI001239E795|nr:DUF255 domain-containing protein [Planctomonas psychrotolerans]
MPNRLVDAVSPYLRSHADNPVDWFAWGDDAFAEAARRDVPILVSIGYSTCHWCHVMARESFSDPALAEVLNDRFVSIKVDREEHPDVDSTYIAAASAFTGNLGWPLNVFVTPEGKAFHAGTYSPPEARGGHPSFRQVLDAVSEAWRDRRGDVEDNAARLSEALTAAAAGLATASDVLPGPGDYERIAVELLGYEDERFGGFGTAPKFPMAPTLLLLESLGGSGILPPERSREVLTLAERTLRLMAASDLRDPVEGGFFRYSTRQDWTEPHYERMLYDNALLLDAYTRLLQRSIGDPRAEADTVTGIADFLTGVLQRPEGGFASAQDSESMVDGVRVEGGYYALDADGRTRQSPPALDGKVLTGWNGLALGALARAGAALDRPDWLDSARRAADFVLGTHASNASAPNISAPNTSHPNASADGYASLLRASLDGRASSATATLEDFGMLAGGLIDLALATGEVSYAEAARGLIDATLTGNPAAPFAPPTGGDPTLAAFGLALTVDLSEGAYPSGLSACASASARLSLLTADTRYAAAARAALGLAAPAAAQRPVSFGAALEASIDLTVQPTQLVVVLPSPMSTSTSTATPTAVDPLLDVARSAFGAGLGAGSVTAAVTAAQAEAFSAAGFELFDGRAAVGGETTAYLCRDFVCRLPVTEAVALRTALEAVVA